MTKSCRPAKKTIFPDIQLIVICLHFIILCRASSKESSPSILTTRCNSSRCGGKCNLCVQRTCDFMSCFFMWCYHANYQSGLNVVFMCSFSLWYTALKSASKYSLTCLALAVNPCEEKPPLTPNILMEPMALVTLTHGLPPLLHHLCVGVKQHCWEKSFALYHNMWFFSAAVWQTRLSCSRGDLR